MYCKRCGKETTNKNNICDECSNKDPETKIITNNVTNSTYINYEPKSKIAAGLLGIFLGSFGVHNFYLGYTGKAIAQLLITIIGGVITCGFSVIATYIWGLIEGILILTGNISTDANGINLKD